MHLFAKFLILLLFLHMIHCDNSSYNETDLLKDRYNKLDAFDGVYTECFLYLSYNCLQRKTLLYLKELDGLSEVPIVGDYLKFVKTNNSIVEEENEIHLDVNEASGEELSQEIDKAVDKFFKTHAMKISALGKEVVMPNTVEEFVGRKKKGGGGGGGGHGHGGDDGGKKKMMMMAMMCMKMKMMVMVPAMMGMMGMMSFKGMMFSMMSFMISKMMLLMKLLEKKNSFSGAGGDPGWATGGGGGGGGAWMPAGPEYGGGGGGYDSNAQWQRRSILSKSTENIGTPKDDKPIITYVKPHMRYNNINKPYYAIVSENKQEDNKSKSRKKRGIVDVLQNAYLYWMNKMLGLYQPNYSNKKSSFQRYRVVNGVKYVYYPSKLVRSKTPKELQSPQSETTEFMKPIAVEDYNKGEIQDEPESRMIKKKINKMVTTVNDTMDQDPWQ